MPVTKYKLYATESGWDNKNTELCSHLDLPGPGAAAYAQKETVENPESDDFGKFIMPVIMTGPFKCDAQFSSGVTDWKDDWNHLPG